MGIHLSPKTNHLSVEPNTVVYHKQGWLPKDNCLPSWVISPDPVWEQGGGGEVEVLGNLCPKMG